MQEMGGREAMFPEARPRPQTTQATPTGQLDHAPMSSRPAPDLRDHAHFRRAANRNAPPGPRPRPAHARWASGPSNHVTFARRLRALRAPGVPGPQGAHRPGGRGVRGRGVRAWRRSPEPRGSRAFPPVDAAEPEARTGATMATSAPQKENTLLHLFAGG